MAVDGAAGGLGRIDRTALVRRHNPRHRAPAPLAPLSVGNGEFAFTADVTGLQTFPGAYAAIPLCTMAQWGWHTTPPEGGGRPPAGLALREYDAHGRHVGYPTGAEGQEAAYAWLRENPHRLHLGRIGLDLGGAALGDLTGVDQELDLWTGLLDSRFRVRGQPVAVRTCVHPRRDVLAIRVRSPLAGGGQAGLVLAFPYGSPGISGADWAAPHRHRTGWTAAGTRAAVRRAVDGFRYGVTLVLPPGAAVARLGPHRFMVTAGAGAEALAVALAFGPGSPPDEVPTVEAVEAACRAHWRRFWLLGAAVELAGSRDARAGELERRVVLSQYLTAVHGAGSLPPAETGLVCNSWYGKFHLEMHWWHAAHFALWNRAHLLRRSIPWYRAVLRAARSVAAAQGYAGARWPKMTGPDGRESPSPVGPLLIWQQPHPLAFAELCYRARPSRATLRRFAPLVHATAEFMASYAHFDAGAACYVLGPPVIPAQECHPPRSTWNPTFELSYWRHGLEIAQRWRERLGLRRRADWDDVRLRLAPLPAAGGVYLAHGGTTEAETYGERARDHPSMLGALGLLPGAATDPETMRRTLRRVLASWDWDRTWGWDYPLVAMTAARLGERNLAVDALLMDTPKNRWSAAGHVRQRENLPVYLPANGGLLLAVAMMAAGWDGSTGAAPGFPADGSWTVLYEGLLRLP